MKLAGMIMVGGEKMGYFTPDGKPIEGVGRPDYGRPQIDMGELAAADEARLRSKEVRFQSIIRCEVNFARIGEAAEGVVAIFLSPFASCDKVAGGSGGILASSYCPNGLCTGFDPKSPEKILSLP
jgi:hypothetical protein